MKDTLKSPPPENQTMKKASTAAILLTTTLYLCCACFGYAAFGDQTPGNLLTGFGFYEPYWLVDFANACVVHHLIGGYQITKKLPDNEFVNNVYTIKLPMLPVFKLNLLRLCFRTTYVASTTGIALLFPYFNDVLGVLGALNFWPLAIYFPAQMYLRQRNIKAWTRMWVVFQAFRAVCLVVPIVASVGSMEGLITTKLS
ncbi:hypothetical protein CsSME_00026766 [Camellia sinensis var. sinensis]